MKVDRFHTWEELRSLQPEWNALLATSSSDTLFLSWEWCEAWWKHYGAGRPLHVLAAREGGDLIGIAPLYVDAYGSKRKALRLIGDGSHDSDYLDCFVRQGREREVMSSFVDSLAERQGQDWHELDFHGPHENSPTAVAISEIARQKGWQMASEAIACAVLPLARDWQGYLGTLKPRFRSKLRSSIRFFEQAGEVPRECGDAANISPWLETLFDLHTRRWQSDGAPGVFRDARKRAFYQDISRSALQQGWLAFHRLNWGERTLARQYGFLYRNRFLLLQEGYDPDFESLRPGIALRGLLVRNWQEAGVQEYDFLAGYSVAKQDWGVEKRSSVRLRIVPQQRLQIAPYGAGLREAARTVAQKVVPERVAEARRQFLRRRERRRWAARPAAGSKSISLRGAVRWSAGAIYSLAPVRQLSQRLVARHCWNAAPGTPWYSRLQRRSAPFCQILLFHRVNDDRDPYLSATPTAEFRAQVEYLAKRFPIITLDQLARGEFPRNCDYCAAITFDDGYRDNLLCAQPILNELGVPATIFLATGYIDSGELPWYDQVCVAFKLTTRKRLMLADMGGPDCSLNDLFSRLQAMQAVLQWLRTLDEHARQRCLAELFGQLHVPNSPSLPNLMLNWEEIRRMSRQGITFGGHTVTHPVMSKLSFQVLRDEVEVSKRAIEAKLQAPVQHFAYPFGAPADYSPEAKAVVQQAGFSTAVTTRWGFNGPGDDLFELKRFRPWEGDARMFALKLDWYRFLGVAQPPNQRAVAAEPKVVAAVAASQVRD